MNIYTTHRTNLTFLILMFIILSLLSNGCSVPDKYDKPVWKNNLQNDMGVNGTQMRLYLQTGSTVKSILPWEHFLEFGNYDIIGVGTGIIKAATIRNGTLVLPEQNVTSSPFLDARTMGFDGGIFLCCTNAPDVTNNGLIPGATSDTINGLPAYNLNTGLSFVLNDSATIPVKATFQIYGIASGVEKRIVPGDFGITFYNAHHTKAAVGTLDSVPASALQMSTTTDSLFTMLLEDLRAYELHALSNTTNEGVDIFSMKLLHNYDGTFGFDTVHIKTIDDSLMALDTTILTLKSGIVDTLIFYNRSLDPYYAYRVGDTVHCGVFENSVVHASAQNAKVVLANRLLRMIDSNHTPSGTGLKTIPPVGPELDHYFGLYSNISGLLEVLDDFKNAYTVQKIKVDHNIYENLGRYLNSIVGSGAGGDVSAVNPSVFSHLVLWYTDYLLYAGLCSYIDDDFFSRYINHHKLLVDAVKTLVDKIADDYNNNIIIRFYAVAAFYDFMLNQNRTNLATLVNYLDDFVSSEGEYGEGISYFLYTSEILLPIVYTAIQEQYLYGPDAGNSWLSADTSRLVLMYRNIGEYLINSATNWGELPAIDDGGPTIPFLAPFAVINNNRRFLNFSRDTRNLMNNGLADSVENAERLGIEGIAPWRMFLYPYNRSFHGSSNWKHNLDSVRHNGSIVQISTGTANDNLNMTIIAEEHPEDGGTHDQIDHGAVQFVRYTNNAGGTAPHVDHLIIDPGYPGFKEDKRQVEEWIYANQNVQMLWDSDFTFTTDRTQGNNSVPSEEPEKDADDEEFLGGAVENKDYNTIEMYDYKKNGGMTGYRYMSPWEIRKMLHKFALRDGGMQNNVWEIVDAMGLSLLTNKTLSSRSGEGKSSVQNRYRNGVEVKIEYKYPKQPEIFRCKESLGSDLWEFISWLLNRIGNNLIGECAFYYSRNIEYETSYYGTRGVYTLGTNYYIIDHLPQDSLPSTVSLAASWKMQKNTTQMGATGWQQFVFEGTTPDPFTTTQHCTK
jgi:hypothetical protein